MDKKLEEIIKAKKFLEGEGFKVIKINELMKRDMDECVEMDSNGEYKDCIGCHCSICLMQSY